MSNTEWAFMALAQFLNDNSFGEITFIVNNGKVVNSKKVVTEKPPVDSDNGKA